MPTPGTATANQNLSKERALYVGKMLVDLADKRYSDRADWFKERLLAVQGIGEAIWLVGGPLSQKEDDPDKRAAIVFACKQVDFESVN